MTLSHKCMMVFLACFVMMCKTSYIHETDQDGTTYQTVKIGEQEWMAENLDVSHFRNGDPIPRAKTEKEWANMTSEGKPAWCYYEQDPENGKKYGKLYNWFAVNDSRGLAPEGWKIPDNDDWETLVNELGGEKVAGAKMKSTEGWYKNEHATNESGFNGLPGGKRVPRRGFSNAKKKANWWSTTKFAFSYAWKYELIYVNGAVVSSNTNGQGDGMSVRCLKK